MNEEKKVIEMTEEEALQFEQFRLQRAKLEAQQRRCEDLEAYEQLIDRCLGESSEILMIVSNTLSRAKKRVGEEFKQAIELKSKLYGIHKLNQFSHTFTNKAGTVRITIGDRMLDRYRDTVNEGVAIIRQEIASFAKDEQTQSLVSIILDLLAKDKSGNLQSSRVLKLKKEAVKLGNERILEGVEIIEQAYQPERSNTYIKLDVRGDGEAWRNVPLGITEA